MTALLAELRALIAAEGPITVERYMQLCLSHPTHGYYRGRDPLGAAGDFTTAPEISQMFGELIGLWAAQVWADMGRPNALQLVELGPGRGTLMADLIRASRVASGFLDAVSVHLVETSPALRAAQRRTLGPQFPATWHEGIDTLPDGPALVIANEFFDALPIRQFECDGAGWRERLVGLDETGRLCFGLAPDPDQQLTRAGARGDIVEWAEVGLSIAARLARRVARQGGAVLAIDYGSVRSGLGDTLQAVERHAFADPLARPGEADLTAHVDFEAYGEAVGACGARVHGPVVQADFLLSLGIEARADMLRRKASRGQEEAINAALERLVGTGPKAMGELFKVLAWSDTTLSTLPGFSPASIYAET